MADNQKRIFLDLDYCIGCRSCESACRSAFNEARIRYGEVAETVFFPIACRHCEEPLCAAACPFEVLKVTENGLVLQASFHCVGCKSCILACPFGVLDKKLLNHVSQKCNLCADRKQGPRCVASCASGALKFLTEDEAKKIMVGKRFLSRSPFWRRL
ncbi:MAG: 4Fe-4S binding protein [candidate division WOR-3 bacterium]|nr:4Fe-4S binding protein [candidate division WOR-3 bacterium]